MMQQRVSIVRLLLQPLLLLPLLSLLLLLLPSWFPKKVVIVLATGHNEETVHRGHRYRWARSSTSTLRSRRRRQLPPKVIVGYASGECNDDQEGVITAVQQGVNVVIWAFYHLSPTPPLPLQPPPPPRDSLVRVLQERRIITTIDMDCIQHVIDTLDQLGFTDTVHLVSMGGWNGPHLDPHFQSATQWYQAWKASVGNLFDGIDIDFEGNDDLHSPWNYVSLAEMDRVGEIMKLAKQDGYSITLAPAQSYLDIHSSNFSQYLNLTDPTRSWHADFSYFGRNLYAYWLANYGDSIDLVMIQFYESFSRAAMEITQRMTPENYLQQYVWDLNQPKEGPGWMVDFGSLSEDDDDDDDDLVASTGSVGTMRHVSLPLSKLVWGFANAWANTDKNSGRNIYFPPSTVQAAYQNLWDWMLEPRGMMFWNIANEGEQGIYYARELNEILHIRTTMEASSTS